MYSILEQMNEVQREIKQREFLYSRFVKENKITQQTADYRLAVLKDVLKTLESINSKDKQLHLF